MSLKYLIKTSLLLLVFCLNGQVNAIASWHGPLVIVQGAWGSGLKEFGYFEGETIDSFPDEFHVLPDGKIAIYDIDGKLKIFNRDGAFVKAIDNIGFGLYELGLNRAIVARKDRRRKINKYSIGLYDLTNEQFVWVDRERWFSYTPDLLVHVAVDNSYFVVWTGASGMKYSASGTLLGMYTTKPLIFGQEKSAYKLSDRNYETTIVFSDATYTCHTPTALDPGQISFTRDRSGFLYGFATVSDKSNEMTSHRRIYKINKCGKVVASLDFPPKRSHAVVIHDPSPATDIVTVDEEYGEPVITPTGDVYTWKRTPARYTILKWSWVHDRDGTMNQCSSR